MLKRQIPSAEELRKKVDAIIDEIDPVDRRVWLADPCTKALILLLEASRMDSIELMENGPESDGRLRQAMAQSQLASSLVDDIQDYIIEPEALT